MISCFNAKFINIYQLILNHVIACPALGACLRIPDEKRSKFPGERFFLDINSIKTRSFCGSKFWLLLVDDTIGYKFIFFEEEVGNCRKSHSFN